MDLGSAPVVLEAGRGDVAWDGLGRLVSVAQDGRSHPIIPPGMRVCPGPSSHEAVHGGEEVPGEMYGLPARGKG